MENIIQKRSFIAKAGMSIYEVKNADNASLLQKKYVNAFDINNDRILSKNEADLFNATTFSEKSDGTVTFWTRKIDGTKQGKKFNIKNRNFKYNVNFEVSPHKSEPQKQNILENAKLFFINILNKLGIKSVPQIDADTEYTWTKKYNWSEGCNRKISTIVINRKIAEDENFIKELDKIAKKAGFKIKVSQYENDSAFWIEDYSIRRADGKIYTLPSMPKIEHDSFNAQNTKRNSKLSEIYSETLKKNNIVSGKSYLEGGNVLNTRLKNGKAGAIIGEKSIEYSLIAMKLEDTPENRKLVKKQIAKDLGIEENNVTYISQYDFHIDMFFRPLQDGIIATPDFEEAIKIIENTKIKGMSEETKNFYLKKLKRLSSKFLTGMTNKIDAKLKQAGYKVQKIPCFNLPSGFISIFDKKTPQINYMNGVCGTSKDNKKYIILNESNYEEINNIIAKYYKKAGISDVYFVPTQGYLELQGGIDCLTQEK